MSVAPYGPFCARIYFLISALCELLVCVLVLLPSLLSSFFFLSGLLPDLSVYFLQNRPGLFPGRRS